MLTLACIIVLATLEPPPNFPDPGPIVVQHCTPCGDYNRDGSIDGADVEAFWADWTDQIGGDVDCNLRIDLDDVSEFLEAWSAGVACP